MRADTESTDGLAVHFALFDTAVGRCAIAWNARGLAGVQLPEPTDALTRARMRRRCRSAVETAGPLPAAVQDVIENIVALLSGERRDLSQIVLDTTGIPGFQLKVYEFARSIPAGSTRTYGQIATALGDTGSARDVGQALAQNPWPIIVPCHRVLAAGGKTGGFSAPGGTSTKIRLLAIERAPNITEQLNLSLPSGEGGRAGT